MCYNSRRPHWVPRLSAKNRKLRLVFTQNWTVNNGETSLDLCCNFQMEGSEFGVNMNGSGYLVSQVMVWRIVSQHSLGTLVPTGHYLNTIAYRSIVADPFMTTVYPSSDVSCHRAQTGFLNKSISSLYPQCPHIYYMSKQQSTFGMRWNMRFTLWMCIFPLWTYI